MSEAGFALSRWGEFSDPLAEASYRAHIQAGTVRHAIIAMLVPAVFVLAYGYNDYLASGIDTRFWVLMAARVLFVAAGLAAVWFAWRRPALVPDGRLVTLIEVLLCGVFMLAVVLRPAPVVWHGALLTLMVLAFYLFAPNRVVYMALVGLGVSAGFLLWLELTAPSTPLLFWRLLLLLAAANTIGLLVAYRLARLQRKEFAMLSATALANEQLARANAQLRGEVRERQRLEEELKRIAATDGLTGLPNRRHFLDLAAYRLQLARAGDRPLTVGLLDLDDFKAINDRYGHHVGDAALRAVAEAAREALREDDVIGRFGGEEFAICLANTPLPAAAQVAGRLREAVAAVRIETPQGPLRLTATIGLAECEPHEDGIEPALQRADAALYEGKRGGRNKVVTTA